mmetsp:Transcript_18051/g.30737  ORF Transcript_18051/g.30737 Transcript_18051/m.30737 type:complete len:318 (-) Transcript_18051:2748-3701(-)
MEDKLRKRVAAMESDLLEQCTSYSLLLDDLKLTNIELKSKARKMENEVLQEEIFALQEKEIQAVEQRTESIRASALRCLNRCLTDYVANVKPGIQGTKRVVQRDLVQLEDSACKLRSEKCMLERRERKDAINKVKMDNKSYFLCKVTKEGRQKLEQLERERLRLAEIQAKAHVTEKEIKNLRKAEHDILNDQRNTAEETTDLRLYAAAVQSEREKQDVLDRFLEKHTSTLNPAYMPTHIGKNVEYARKLMGQITCELDVLEGKMPSLTITKLRIEIEKMKQSVFDALEREEHVSNTLVNYVNCHPEVKPYPLNHPTS